MAPSAVARGATPNTKLAGPMPPPGALGSKVENLPTRPTVPGNLPEGAMNPNATPASAMPQGVGALKHPAARGTRSFRASIAGSIAGTDRVRTRCACLTLSRA